MQLVVPAVAAAAALLVLFVVPPRPRSGPSLQPNREIALLKLGEKLFEFFYRPAQRINI